MLFCCFMHLHSITIYYNMNPFISIIIPVYNTEKYISDCLDSILAQTYKNFEVIIIDDGSTDNSLSICNTYKEKNKNISVLHIENSGVSAARNTGIKHAKGEFLLFVDSDDTLYEYSLSKFIKELTSPNIDILIGGSDITYYPYNKTSKYWGKNLKSYSIKENFEIYAKGDFIITPWNKLVKKSFIIKHDLFFEYGIINEDELWNFKLLFHAKNIKTFQSSTYIYRIRENSIMSTITNKHIESHKKIVLLMYNYIIKHKKQGLPSIIISFEAFKNQCMRYAINLLSIKQQYDTYLLLRRNTFPLYKCFISKSINIRRLFSYIHYILPPTIGFKIYRKILSF